MEQKNDCVICRMLKNLFIFVLGVMVGIFVGIYFSLGLL